jgi:hypothetical protein
VISVADTVNLHNYITLGCNKPIVDSNAKVNESNNSDNTIQNRQLLVHFFFGQDKLLSAKGRSMKSL